MHVFFIAFILSFINSNFFFLVQLLRINEQILTNAYNLGEALLVSTYILSTISISVKHADANWPAIEIYVVLFFCCAAYLLLLFKTLLYNLLFHIIMWMISRKKAKYLYFLFLIPNSFSLSLPIMHCVQFLFQITFRSINTITSIIFYFLRGTCICIFVQINLLRGSRLRLLIKARVGFCMLPLKMIFSHSLVSTTTWNFLKRCDLFKCE